MAAFKRSEKVTIWEIAIAFFLWLIAMSIQHYVTSMWGCLLSAVVLLVDIAWIMTIGTLNGSDYD